MRLNIVLEYVKVLHGVERLGIRSSRFSYLAQIIVPFSYSYGYGERFGQRISSSATYVVVGP